MGSIKVLQFGAFLLSIHLISYLLDVDGKSHLPIEESLELSSLNIHRLKTIKTKYGDIYDCVELYKQPALRHPLLKDHKIQMRPTFSTQKNVSGKGFPSNFRHGLKTGCPPGTVPIRRTTKEEELRANVLFRQLFQGPKFSNGQENRFAGITTSELSNSPNVEEAGGYVSTHNPGVGNGQLSASVMSLEYGPPSTFGVIRIGWMVYPDLYKGDNRTRLYTSWGQFNNSSVQGCFNIYCPGFVQVNHDIAIDMVVDQISKPAGEYHYIKLGLSLDDKNSWWFNYGEDETPVGYWPANLFTGLQGGADLVRFGGWVATTTPRLPAMGSGLLGNLGSQMRKLWADSHRMKAPANTNYQVSQNTCYKAGINPYKEDYWGYSFWYGGNAADLQQCPNN